MSAIAVKMERVLASVDVYRLTDDGEVYHGEIVVQGDLVPSSGLLIAEVAVPLLACLRESLAKRGRYKVGDTIFSYGFDEIEQIQAPSQS